jgi:hypothetical protein
MRARAIFRIYVKQNVLDNSYTIILWCIDSLLGKNLETDDETAAVAMQ